MKRSYLFALALTLLYVCVAQRSEYPVMDKIANKVIQKYQTLHLRATVAEEGARRPRPHSRSRRRSRC